jgi:N-acetylglutamate synthase-like GNAT family acetyltransferase
MAGSTSIVIRDAVAADAPAISKVILDSLRTTNARDYACDIIERLAQTFTVERVTLQLKERQVVVALVAAEIVGTASLGNGAIHAVFVAPNLQNKGIGETLMRELHRRAAAGGITKLTVQSSITAQRFYAKLGYIAVGDKYHGAERTIIMERYLEADQ